MNAEQDRSVIVVLQDGVDAASVAKEHADRERARVRHVYRHVLRGYAASMSDAAVERIKRDRRVRYVEADGEVRVGGHLQFVPTGVDRIDADLDPVAKIDGTDGANGSVERVDVDVAVIDTGIYPHVDLNVVASTDCTATVDPKFPVCVDGAGVDDHGHGTHVAGTVGALDNAYGVVGVAPGVRLHSVKVLTAAGAGLTSAVIAGMDWVAARHAVIEVVNMSLGGSGYSQAQHEAFQGLVGAGVVTVVAAGNDAKDVYGADGVFKTRDDTSPAAFPEAMTISALADFDGRPGGLSSSSAAFTRCTESRDDSFACFSNYSGSVDASNPVSSPGKAIDLILPGVRITSTFLGDQYATYSGTSMAAPHGAGLAALYIAVNGRATDATSVYGIRQALINAGQAMFGANGLVVDDDPDGNHENVGWPQSTSGDDGGGGPTTGEPTADFSTRCKTTTCHFDGSWSTDPDGTITSWSWSFGDGGTGSGIEVSHTYSGQGEYVATLVVTDDSGNTASHSRTIACVQRGNAVRCR